MMNSIKKYLPKSELLKILKNNHIGQDVHEFAERIYIGEQCYKLERKSIHGRYMYAVVGNENLII